MKILKKKKDSEKLKRIEESNRKAFELGTRIGEKLHFPQFVNRMNKIGSKSPKLFFIIVLSIIGLSVFSPFVFQRGEKAKNMSEIIPIKIENANMKAIMAENGKEIDSVVTEINRMDNEVKVLQAKKNKSHQDSVYLGEKIKKIKLLESILEIKPK